jgi:hypothetical protein
MNGPKNVTVSFAPPLAIAPTALPAAEVGLPYSSSLVPAGGIPPYTVTISFGALPRGLSLVGNDIVGTPTVAGKRTFTIKVRDQLGGSIGRRYTLTVHKPPAITGAALKAGTMGRGYAAAVTTAGGRKPFTWSVLAGELPVGLTLNNSTGQITGTPSVQGVFAPTFGLIDALGGTAQKTLTLQVR